MISRALRFVAHKNGAHLQVGVDRFFFNWLRVLIIFIHIHLDDFGHGFNSS